MMGKFVCTVAAAMLTLCLAAYAHAAQYGTADEARAMLDKAVAAVKQNKIKALDMFNKGEGGFKDRDLYVLASRPHVVTSPLPTPAASPCCPQGNVQARLL